MCRAVKVLCVATDGEELARLKGAAIAAEWELCPGATDVEAATEQLETERPHMLVTFGPFEEFVASVADRYPGMRIISDRDAPGAVVATSLDDVRDLLRSRPGGPIG